MINFLLIEIVLLHLCLVVTSSLVPVAELHPPKPYKFGYAIKDKHGEQYREEAGDGLHEVKGSYGFVDERGIKRQVNYVADKEGYRAEVKTNEPGTAPENPASVKMISSTKPLEEAVTETKKKESPISASELKKYFESIADIYSLGYGKSSTKESMFAQGLEEVKKDSVIEKEGDESATSEAKFELEQLLKAGFKFPSYLENAGVPFAKKEDAQKKKIGFGKQFGLEYLVPDEFTLLPIGAEGKAGFGDKGLLFGATPMFHKLEDMGLAYSPFMAGSLDSLIPLKSAVNIKGFGVKHLMKGISLAPATNKNGLTLIPMYNF